MKLILFALGLWALAACSTLEGIESLKQSTFDFQADLIIDVDGEQFRGAGATFIAAEKQIKITAPMVIDYIFMHTCARYEQYPRFGDKPIKSNSVTITYRPVKSELQPCLLIFEVYSLKGLAAWGVLGFRKGEKGIPAADEMPATAYFNGQKSLFYGHSVGQTKAGVGVTIEFEKPVDFVGNTSCGAKRVSPSEYLFRPAKGWCFGSFSDGEKFHDLTILGFERAYIRE